MEFRKFELVSKYKPTGDQPEAIKALAISLYTASSNPSITISMISAKSTLPSKNSSISLWKD